MVAHAGELAEVALANVVREYPHYESHWRLDDTPVPAIRELHPCFYGSFDWHSCVEMFWVLVHLLRRYPTLVPADEIPAWYRNLMANPRTVVEAGAGEIPVEARLTAGEERARIWAEQIALVPKFAEFEASSGRQVPVVLLERR